MTCVELKLFQNFSIITDKSQEKREKFHTLHRALDWVSKIGSKSKSSKN